METVNRPSAPTRQTIQNETEIALLNNLLHTKHHPVNPLAHIPQIGFVAAHELGCDISCIADIREGLADGGPINVTVAEVYKLAWNGLKPFVSTLKSFR